MDGEINNYKKTISAEISKNEKLAALRDKFLKEGSYLEVQLQQFNERREALNQELAQLEQQLEDAEKKLVKVVEKRRGLEDQINALQKESDSIMNERVALDETIGQNLQIQKTLEKGASSTEQGTTKLLSSVREKV
jgi:chromosome segregation ATPase